MKTNLINGKSDFELLNVVSVPFKILSLVVKSGSGQISTNFYYTSTIGNASNLSVGNFMFLDTQLTISAGAGTYIQIGSDTNSEKHCGFGTAMSMTLDSSGRITSLACNQP